MTRLLLALAASTTLFACESSGPAGNPHRSPPPGVGASNTVKFASTDGRFVGLADGSLWNVDWSSASAAGALRPGQPVRVERVGGGSFPYQLTPQGGAPVRARLGKKLD